MLISTKLMSIMFKFNKEPLQKYFLVVNPVTKSCLISLNLWKLFYILRVMIKLFLCPWNTCSSVWCRNDLFAWRHNIWDKSTYAVLQVEQFNEVNLLSVCDKLLIPVLHKKFAFIPDLCSFSLYTSICKSTFF